MRLLYLHPSPAFHYVFKLQEIKEAGWDCIASEKEREIKTIVNSDQRFDLFLTEYPANFSESLLSILKMPKALWYGDIRRLGEIPEKLRKFLPLFDYFLVTHSDPRYFQQWKNLGAKRVIRWDNACRKDFPLIKNKGPYDFFFAGNFHPQFPGSKIRKSLLMKLKQSATLYLIGFRWNPKEIRARPIYPFIWNNDFAEHLKLGRAIILIENFPDVRGFRTEKFFPYMASGLPLFVYDEGAYEDEKEELNLFFFKTAEELIEKAKEILENKSLCERIKNQHRRWFLRHGCWKARFKELQELIK